MMDVPFDNILNNNLPPEVIQYMNINQFQKLSDERKRLICEIFSKPKTNDEYSNLSLKIKKFFPKELFLKTPDSVKEFLIKSKGDDFKDSQLLYLSKLPWGNYDIADKSVSEAKEILEKTHSGMKSVKERILRYIACQKHVGVNYGVIMLLVGPPGVGKTSIAKAIADAMGRSFVKISLAGSTDAIVLKGTSSIFSDSKPGMIIESLIKANNFSPLILLDEVDKMGASTEHGNPAYALLDILDSNRTQFIDDFFGIPLDLSHVVFVITANNLATISPILLNRVEVIKLNGYNVKEKIEIAEKHVLPNLYSEYKVSNKEIVISTQLLEYIITHFTNEPGIRSLERILRKVIETVVYHLELGECINAYLQIKDINSIMDISTTSKKIHKSKNRNNVSIIKKSEDRI